MGGHIIIYDRDGVVRFSMPPLPVGPQGPQGPQGDIPNHQWISTSLQFELPNGSWGDLVDLKGDPGDPKTPADSVTAETSFGTASNAGAATTYSRGDHTHGTPSLPQALGISDHPEFAYLGLNITPDNSYTLKTSGSISVTHGSIILDSSGYVSVGGNLILGYQNMIYYNSQVFSVLNFGPSIYIQRNNNDSLPVFYIKQANTLATGDIFQLVDKDSNNVFKVNYTGDSQILSTLGFYFGDKNTDGTWCIIRSGNNLEIQRRESGNYINKTIITP